MHQQFQITKLEDILVIFKGVLTRRNKFYFWDIFYSPNKVISFTLVNLADFRDAQVLKTEAAVVTGESIMLTKWQKLVEGITKVNFDATLDGEN